jgi:octaprenyl-diphosphate synthase
MDQQVIRTLADDDMQAVNQLIYQRLQSDVALVNQLAYYIISGGGKRVRPLLAVLAARAIDYQGDAHIRLATIIEFIHTATLLHDDVVDESALRRGRDTANQLFGNAASVLVGDFLHTRAFQMMVELGNMQVMQLLSDATNLIAEGEVMQLMNCNDPSTTEDNYLQVIYCKTAKLFEAATHCAAILANQPAHIELALRDYGKYLGTAFQLIDDVMDYSSSSQTMGKNVGDDLAEGKPTLPLIHAMRQGTPEQSKRIAQAITERDGKSKSSAEKEAIDWSFLRSARFWLLTGLLFFQNAAEQSVNGWMVTYFKGSGIIAGTLAAYTVTVMWGATLVGRLLIAFVFPLKNPRKAMVGMSVLCTVFYVLLVMAHTQGAAIALLFAIALSTSSIEINSPDRFLYFISADFASNSALFASAIIFFLFASNTSLSVVSFSDSLC